MARDRVTFVGWSLGAVVLGAEGARRGDAVIVGAATVVVVVAWVACREVLR